MPAIPVPEEVGGAAGNEGSPHDIDPSVLGFTYRPCWGCGRDTLSKHPDERALVICSRECFDDLYDGGMI